MDGGTLQALISIGFSQNEADRQLRELNDMILRKAVERVIGEAPSPLSSENDMKTLVEMYYSPEDFKRIFSEVAGEVMEGYYRSISRQLDPQQKVDFYQQIMNDIPKSQNTTPSVPQPAY
jgi:Holliday junction resolvasome RuvABC DNA-binding subunit